MIPTSASKRESDFAAGILDEPFILFGDSQRHIDPKFGIMQFGPFSLPGQPRALSQIRVGIVGSPDLVSDMQAWLVQCERPVYNDGAQPHSAPHFPGFSASTAFHCSIFNPASLNVVIRDAEFKKALLSPNFNERVSKIVSIYSSHLNVLAGREPQPDVVICCLPQDVVDTCVVNKKRPPKQKWYKKFVRKKKDNQGDLFDNTDASEEEELLEHSNLRRGLKGAAMLHDFPIQIVWPKTIALRNIVATGKSTQDAATRAWNFMTALYYKAGGTPWRAHGLDEGTCYIGVSFFHDANENSIVRTSMAQTFSASGQGYVLRGSAFEWDDRNGASPHLDKASASKLLTEAVELYTRQNGGARPSRVVVHKSSKYWEEELEGFVEALVEIPNFDLVAFDSLSRIQLVRSGLYAPLRGSYVKLATHKFLLYTVGYSPFLKTYQGPRTPVPLQITEHHGDTPWRDLLNETLALTKMNWNSANFASSDPITLAFSRKVGEILSELPSSVTPRPEYRYYM
jgi:hypothetical protein